MLHSLYMHLWMHVQHQRWSSILTRYLNALFDKNAAQLSAYTINIRNRSFHTFPLGKVDYYPSRLEFQQGLSTTQ